MSKIDDKIEELEEWKAHKEIEDGIRRGITKRMLAICMTATGAALTAMGKLGAWAYDNLSAIQAAIDAFIKTQGKP